MIATLRGTVTARDTRSLILDVNGVGYRIFVGPALLQRESGEVVDVFTSLHMANDTIELYGFATADELGLFQSLLKVSGVGPRSAVTLLGGAGATELRTAIINGDPAPLMRVPGIGKKIAERIILELSGTLAQRGATAADDEAIDALERLGYTRREAADALRNSSSGDIRDRIRAALKALNAHRS